MTYSAPICRKKTYFTLYVDNLSCNTVYIVHINMRITDIAGHVSIRNVSWCFASGIYNTNGSFMPFNGTNESRECKLDVIGAWKAPM